MTNRKEKRIIIIGGGPTGLGAAYHLNKLRHKNWVLYEKSSYLGGHSSTHKDEKGFLWDEGGHVLFSHFGYFDEFVADALGDEYFSHERESWIRAGDSWVPYPFQNNIRYLSPDLQMSCISGLIEARRLPDKNQNFHDWIYSTFGKGIADIFMVPYNFKVWAVPARLMSCGWVGERVSVVDTLRVLSNVIHQKDDVAWGPNNKFIFPKYGTQQIYEKAGAKLEHGIKTDSEVVGVDLRRKVITFRDGSLDNFDYLISAMPINRLVGMTGAPSSIKKSVQGLVYNGIIIVGIGLRMRIKTSKCWAYFADKETPFYRLTYFHNYSPFLVPDGDVEQYSSLMCEVSYSQYKKIDKEAIAAQCIEGLIRNGIITEKDKANIVSVAQYDIPYGYPIPTLDRDARLKTVQSYLKRFGIYSRGRYGAWKYEISNMDHCFMQGVEAVENIIFKKKEKVWTL